MVEYAYLWRNERRESSSGDVGHNLIQLIRWWFLQEFNCTYEDESSCWELMWWSVGQAKLSSFVRFRNRSSVKVRSWQRYRLRRHYTVQTSAQGPQQSRGSPVLQQLDPHIINHHNVTPTHLPARRHILNPRHENIQHPIPPLCRRTSSKVQPRGSSQCPGQRKGRFDFARRTGWCNGKTRTGLQCCCGLPDIVCGEARQYKRHRRLTIDSNFSPIPKRVMDGSEPGESVAAAVLSGAPVELQARTVRCISLSELTNTPANERLQNLPPSENRNTIRYMALTRLEDRLGPTSKGSQVGESSHGLAIFCRLHER